MIGLGSLCLGKSVISSGVSLPMGSYLCLVRHPHRAAVRYPVHIGRGAHGQGVRPGHPER